MASTGILITNFGSIISGDMNGLRTSEVRNPFHCVLTLYLCNNAPPLPQNSMAPSGVQKRIRVKGLKARYSRSGFDNPAFH
ncbi:MAG: hypothetical protein E5299_01831 [Burkholderia gladioli]|nr:MAG: hypothetical protein E5299_01831 [Burkholderia gladioli]